jgi:hypothetical protein
MARSNPDKLKPRAAKETRLIVVEGPDDRFFAQHLKQLYLSREAGVAISIEPGTGGSPVETVRLALRLGADVAIFDGDRAELEEALKLAAGKSLRCIVMRPNLDSMLLEIKGHKKIAAARAKSVFESTYMTDKQRRLTAHYNRVFPKDVLEAARVRLEILDEIIRIFEVD